MIVQAKDLSSFKPKRTRAYRLEAKKPPRSNSVGSFINEYRPRYKLKANTYRAGFNLSEFLSGFNIDIARLEILTNIKVIPVLIAMPLFFMLLAKFSMNILLVKDKLILTKNITLPDDKLADTVLAETRADLNNTENLKLASLRGRVPQKLSTITYEIKEGESLSTVSYKYNISYSTLISYNALTNVKQLPIGKLIIVPNMDGILHQVQKNESFESIAKHYNVALSYILDANDIDDPHLNIGMDLFVPNASISNYELHKALGDLFTYPLSKHVRLSSGFGYRANPFRPKGQREFHDGIDLASSYNTPVLASSFGKVLVTGYHSIYGNYIIIQHNDGIKTLYGHLAKILVKKNQSIAQGAEIGRVGSTGRSTGPHLHFGVYLNGKVVDPNKYLNR